MPISHCIDYRTLPNRGILKFSEDTSHVSVGTCCLPVYLHQMNKFATEHFHANTDDLTALETAVYLANLIKVNAR